MIINLMPHVLVIVLADGSSRTIAPSGLARCKAVSVPVREFEEVPLTRTTYGAVEGLPDPVDGVLYVVSALVRAAVPSRTDVASPGDLVRDSAGNVTGCRTLSVN